MAACEQAAASLLQLLAVLASAPCCSGASSRASTWRHPLFSQFCCAHHTSRSAPPTFGPLSFYWRPIRASLHAAGPQAAAAFAHGPAPPSSFRHSAHFVAPQCPCSVHSSLLPAHLICLHVLSAPQSHPALAPPLAPFLCIQHTPHCCNTYSTPRVQTGCLREGERNSARAAAASPPSPAPAAPAASAAAAAAAVGAAVVVPQAQQAARKVPGRAGAAPVQHLVEHKGHLQAAGVEQAAGEEQAGRQRSAQKQAGSSTGGQHRRSGQHRAATLGGAISDGGKGRLGALGRRAKTSRKAHRQHTHKQASMPPPAADPVVADRCRLLLAAGGALRVVALLRRPRWDVEGVGYLQGGPRCRRESQTAECRQTHCRWTLHKAAQLRAMR
jgi:hypothetical protein